MDVLGGIALAFVFVLILLFHEEIGGMIAFIVFGVAIPGGILSFSFQLISNGNQGAGGFLIGIVIICWLIIGFGLKDELFSK